MMHSFFEHLQHLLLGKGEMATCKHVHPSLLHPVWWLAFTTVRNPVFLQRSWVMHCSKPVSSISSWHCFSYDEMDAAFDTLGRKIGKEKQNLKALLPYIWWHPFWVLFLICGRVALRDLKHGSRAWKAGMKKQPALKQHDLGTLLFLSSVSLCCSHTQQARLLS